MVNMQETFAQLAQALPGLQATQTATQAEALQNQRALTEAVLLVHQDLQILISVVQDMLASSERTRGKMEQALDLMIEEETEANEDRKRGWD